MSHPWPCSSCGAEGCRLRYRGSAETPRVGDIVKKVRSRYPMTVVAVEDGGRFVVLDHGPKYGRLSWPTNTTRFVKRGEQP